MASYTCISCRVAFSDGEVQRAHYKTDWHRYNLKRKVADMPPVTAENFQERVLEQRASAEQQLSEAATTQGCSNCNKRFSSTNAYQNHLQSHKHKQAEKQAVRAAQRKVDKMNEKNLEKGLGNEKVDHNARNEALQQALKEQHKSSPAKHAKFQEAPGAAKQRLEKPPRMKWLEEQTSKRKQEVGATAEDDEWEDFDEEEDDKMEEDADDAEQVMYEAEESGSDPHPATLPGSIPITDCLFCSNHSRTLMKNVTHMTKVHSFFIPDVEFVIDLKGLICYLGEKVGAGNVCLWCNEKGRSFYSTEAVQSHMIDKSHCKLFTDGDAALEFADFYDFRSSYPGKTEGEEAEMDEDDLFEQKNLEYDDETLELTLPSGAKIGHRSLMRYYKQRFGIQRAVAVSHNKNAVGRVLRQYRALGWGGDLGKAGIQQKHKDMQYVQMMKSRWMLKMAMKHNTTKQKHFRVQVLF